MPNSVKMYHPNSREPVRAHPGQVANMQQRGWATEPPAAAPTAKASAGVKTRGRGGVSKTATEEKT